MTTPSIRTDLVDDARRLGPLLAEFAPQVDRDRRVADDVMAALAQCGLASLAVPRAFGGQEANLATMLAVTSTLAESCGATAWVIANRNVGAFVAALLPARAQEEIFGEDPSGGIAGSFDPSTRVERVRGGLVVSGRWYYASGSSHASWALLAMMETDDQGAPRAVNFGFAPMSELSIEDTWHTSGMRGTASNCLVGNDLFIPSHRLFPVFDALQHRYPREDRSRPLYRSTFAGYAPMNLAGPVLGLARAALHHVVAGASTRGIATTTYRRQADATAFQIEVARAAIKIDTAALHLERAAGDVDRAALDDRMLDLPTRARVRADCAHAVAEATDAIQVLTRAHGAGSFADTNRMQRLWRDATIASHHGALLQPYGFEIYGKALLGIDRNITALL